MAGIDFQAVRARVAIAQVLELLALPANREEELVRAKRSRNPWRNIGSLWQDDPRTTPILPLCRRPACRPTIG